MVAAVLAAFQIRCGGGGARDRTAFLGRLDASGLPLWVVPLFTNSESPSASEVAFVGDALFVTGYFDAPETLEGFTLTPTSANTADAVLLRVGADGAVEHALSYGSASADFVFQMSDSAAGIAVGGQFVESLTIDGRSVAPAAAGSARPRA